MEKDNFKSEFDKRLYMYAVEIIRFVGGLSKDTVSQVLAKQLVRSGTSVTANVFEARSASSRKDYINFYTHALKSANESRLWISLIVDTYKTDKDKANELLSETIEISKILGASIITMKKNNGKV